VTCISVVGSMRTLTTYVLYSGYGDEKFEAEEFWESFAADHEMFEAALEADHVDDGCDCGSEFEDL